MMRRVRPAGLGACVAEPRAGRGQCGDVGVGKVQVDLAGFRV